jgi:hypothetical protein
MTIKSVITDGCGEGLDAGVHFKQDVPPGLVAFTEPYRDFIAQTKPLLSETTGGINANVDASFSGTPDGIHNGTDTALWTATAISGTWTFDSTGQAQAGTKSIDATATVDNNEAQLERSSAITANSYTAMTGYIYITAWPATGTKEVELRTRLAGVDVGNTVSLSNYVSTGTLNTWQKFTIPLADFGLGADSIDQVIVKTVDIGGGVAPDYYLDTMQWEETGSETFSVTPDLGTKYYVTHMSITMADAYDGTLASASHPNIKYNQLLGVSKLTNGIVFRLTTDQIVRFSGIFQQHIDYMTFPGLKVTTGGDATNTWLQYDIVFDYPFVMDSRTKDKLEMTLSDDLSGLLYHRVLVRGYTETIA